MKRHLLRLLVSLVVLCGVGCGSSSLDQVSGQSGNSQPAPSPPTPSPTPPAGQSSVRLAHLLPDSSNIDVFVNGEQVVSNLGFGQLSPYVKLKEGENLIQVRAVGDGQEIVSEKVSLRANSFQTIGILSTTAVANQSTTASLVVFTDNVTPVNDKASFRILHAARFAPPVKFAAHGVSRGTDNNPGTEFTFPITSTPLAFGQTIVVNSFDVRDFHRVRSVALQDAENAPLAFFNGPSTLPSGPLISAYENWKPEDGVNATIFLLGGDTSDSHDLTMLIVVDGGDAAGLSISGNSVLPPT